MVRSEQSSRLPTRLNRFGKDCIYADVKRNLLSRQFLARNDIDTDRIIPRATCAPSCSTAGEHAFEDDRAS